MSAGFRLADPRQFLALGFGSGLLPRAPGTAGTVVAAPLVWGLGLLPAWAYVTVLAAAFAIGCWICGVTARAVGVDDHPAIVWDEFVGLAATLALAPQSPAVVAAGVVAFRVFDILKPWPIRVFDRRLHGGFGIMLDDVLAAVPAAVCLHLALALLG
ncbi:Phosphatidylglycerophosphatase A [wastewater metagenome]|uniref:Phosphatidylglycerophosphatase A n=2 Tax=unclassified sequences TaxID=12908 RepID=A0A5B8RBR6_9ZZZZ|nr:phosphatidylglycerophosphatase A [uncultured organism]